MRQWKSLVRNGLLFDVICFKSRMPRHNCFHVTLNRLLRSAFVAVPLTSLGRTRRTERHVPAPLERLELMRPLYVKLFPLSTPWQGNLGITCNFPVILLLNPCQSGRGKKRPYMPGAGWGGDGERSLFAEWGVKSMRSFRVMPERAAVTLASAFARIPITNFSALVILVIL